ncbi:hypothetical protein GpartN1_g6580.t1 [Galdieria partita]|uniref:Uncharacterized protein n=1 Tax=Galdieria partita TaxID=83374 RepID=A0A9C7Q1V4_9RHOD|nr:hypothetical protein GpartN1_g6580.t1 [Galdieria partita]
MFLLERITDEDWKYIKSSRKAHSFSKYSKAKESSLEELNYGSSLPLQLVEDTSLNTGTNWLLITTPELKVASRNESDVQVIPLKEGVEDMFFSALNSSFKQLATSPEISWDCVVVETVIAVSIRYNEQYIETHSALSNASGHRKLTGYAEVERIQSIISGISQLEKQLQTMHERLINIRSSLTALNEDSAAASNETVVQYLNKRNGIMNCLFCCLQRILLFENKIMQVKSHLRLKEQESIAEIKGRTDRVLEFDIAGVFFSAVFSGVLMVPAYFAFNMLIPIEHLKNGSTYYFIAVVIVCFIAIFMMAVFYAKWLRKNRKMRVLFAKSLSLVDEHRIRDVSEEIRQI